MKASKFKQEPTIQKNASFFLARKGWGEGWGREEMADLRCFVRRFLYFDVKSFFLFFFISLLARSDGPNSLPFDRQANKHTDTQTQTRTSFRLVVRLTRQQSDDVMRRTHARHMHACTPHAPPAYQYTSVPAHQHTYYNTFLGITVFFSFPVPCVLLPSRLFQNSCYYHTILLLQSSINLS